MKLFLNNLFSNPGVRSRSKITQGVKSLLLCSVLTLRKNIFNHFKGKRRLQVGICTLTLMMQIHNIQLLYFKIRQWNDNERTNCQCRNLQGINRHTKVRIDILLDGGEKDDNCDYDQQQKTETKKETPIRGVTVHVH